MNLPWIFKNKIFAGIICIALAVIFAFVITPTVEKAINKTETVVVLNTDVEANTVIEDDMLKVIETSVSDLPKNIVSKKDDAVGLYTSIPIFKNDFLTLDKLSTTNNSSYFKLLSDNLTAVAVSTDSLASSIGGQLVRGDIVSVVAYDGKEDALISYAELEKIEVLDVLNNNAESIGEEAQVSVINAVSSINKKPDTIILKCDFEQAKLLVQLENKGKIHFIYRTNAFEKGAEERGVEEN